MKLKNLKNNNNYIPGFNEEEFKFNMIELAKDYEDNIRYTREGEAQSQPPSHPSQNTRPDQSVQRLTEAEFRNQQEEYWGGFH